MFDRKEFLKWASEAQSANTHGTDYHNSLKNPALNMHVDNTPAPIKEEVQRTGFSEIPKTEKPKKATAMQRIKEMARKQI